MANSQELSLSSPDLKNTAPTAIAHCELNEREREALRAHRVARRTGGAASVRRSLMACDMVMTLLRLRERSRPRDRRRPASRARARIERGIRIESAFGRSADGVAVAQARCERRSRRDRAASTRNVAARAANFETDVGRREVRSARARASAQIQRHQFVDRPRAAQIAQAGLQPQREIGQRSAVDRREASQSQAAGDRSRSTTCPRCHSSARERSADREGVRRRGAAPETRESLRRIPRCRAPRADGDGRMRAPSR